MGNWEVDLSLIAPWLKEQDKETIIGVTVALNELRDVGPGLGRPLVDTVKGSSFFRQKRDQDIVRVRPEAACGDAAGGRQIGWRNPRAMESLVCAGYSESR